MGIAEVQQVTVTSGTTAGLLDLDMFTNYTIFVEAFTIAVGARSESVTVMTREDGQLTVEFYHG